MDWYYAEAGQQRGPIAESQLEDMIRSGKKPTSTLVWREGMAQWQPYAALHATTSAAGSMGPANTAHCAECGQYFSTSDVVRLGNSWVCARCKPVFLQRLQEGAPPPSAMAVWRSRKLLVVSHGAQLPDRCVKCNTPAHGQRLVRKLYWHSPALYLLILVNLLIYALVAIFVRKKARVEIGICDAHLRQRRLAIGGGWLFGLGGFITFIAGMVIDRGLLGLTGFIAFLGGLIYGGVVGPVVSAKGIDPDVVRIRGAGRQFLDTLPEWNEKL
jgi:hypothetical protein